MSAFGIGTNMESFDSGAIRGRQIQIACKTWFTSNGSVKPLSFKFEGDDGMIQTVGAVSVSYSEDKNYSGILSREYGCRAVIGGLMHEFKLVFFPEECRWIMILPE